MRLMSIIAASMMAASLLSPSVAMAEIPAQGIFSKKTSTATSNGKAAGVALKSLYSQYKADGKLNMQNVGNIVNLATLANNLKGLKGQSDKSVFYKDFASGLVTGSGNLVNDSNSGAVMGGLAGLVNNVDLSGIQGAISGDQGNGAGEIKNASEIASSVSGILNMFKK